MSRRSRLFALSLMTAVVVLAPLGSGATRAFGAQENVIYCTIAGEGAFKPALHTHTGELTKHTTRHGVAISGEMSDCFGSDATAPRIGSGTFTASGHVTQLSGGFPPSCEDMAPLPVVRLKLKAKLFDVTGHRMGVSKGVLTMHQILVDGDDVEVNLTGTFSSGPFAHNALHLYVELDTDAAGFAAACAAKTGFGKYTYGGNGFAYFRIGS